jgi:hypothetical protein
MEVCKNTTMSRQEAEAVVGQIWAEHLVADTPRNADLIEQFLEENHCDYTVENVHIAVRALGYPKDQLDRRKPEPPPPPPPPPVVEEPVEVLKPGQLSLKCSKWDLEHASKEQVKDWLERARKAGMK